MCEAQNIGNCVGKHWHRCIRNCCNIAALGGIGLEIYVGAIQVNFTMSNNKLLALGITGTVLAALCCFTPILPIVLTALGLTGLLGVLYNDAVLLPLLAFFILLTGFTLWRRKKQ